VYHCQMVNSFDDFVERETTYDPLSDRFRDQRLLGLPRTEWPSYLDQTAVDLLWNVQIEDFRMLDGESFGRELGSFYKQGLSSLGGRYSDIGTLLNDRIDDSTLGDMVYQLNQLNYDIQKGVEGITDVQHATEAVVEKLLTHSPSASVDATMQLGGGRWATSRSGLCGPHGMEPCMGRCWTRSRTRRARASSR
jgi:hypothetical protein